MNLNTDTWKTFYLKKLYHIQMGSGLDKNKLNLDDKEVNLVSRLSYNNGVDCKVGYIDKLKPFDAGLLTVALGGSYLGSCFVQEEQFYTAQNVAVMRQKCPEINHAINLFISSLVRFECKTKYYAFGRELNIHLDTDFNIKLPIQHDARGNPLIDSSYKYSDDGYIPDWQFMEDYIKSLHHKPLTTKNKADNVSSFEVNNWIDFKLSDLFEVAAGKYHYADEYELGNTPYITAADTNNGIGLRINLNADFAKNKITIGKIGATAYYQNEDFCATSDVNVLTSKFRLNKYIGLFIVQVINYSQRFRWAYGRQCRIGDTKDIVIKLPVITKEDGTYEPDWKYMENYIKSLPYGDRI